jgi:radical SAM/Cys-rich protein
MRSSLLAQKHELAAPDVQLQQLNTASANIEQLPKFQETLAEIGLFPLRPKPLEIFQINLGKLCNQVCAHCHVDAGPDRKEIMTQATMKKILQALARSSAHTIDITGGAPEMHPYFRWFVQELAQLHKHIIVRSNLTILLAHPIYHDLPHFFKQHQIHVISSLPCYSEERTDRQRGEGVFADSLQAIKMLNAVGYGKPDSGLILDLVYNPDGAFLPPDQSRLEQEYKHELSQNYGLVFNHLFTITNMPIARFLASLLAQGNLKDYMEQLIHAFNPQAAEDVMCRNTLSVGWDGKLYDCDFNQMLEIPLTITNQQTIDAYAEEPLATRAIAVNQHCYGCTAGSGSSCGGAII